MAKRFKLNVGDIFTIPLAENEVGFGQIICFPRTKDVFIMVVFDAKIAFSYTKEYNMEEIVTSKILFLGYSTDAKLYHKDWEVIGNYTSNISAIVMPYHRLGTPPGDIYLTNYKSERVCEIDEETFNKLNYLTNYAPIRYENALKAYFGLQEWKEEDYDKLLYKHTLKSNEIAQKVLSNA